MSDSTNEEHQSNSEVDLIIDQDPRTSARHLSRHITELVLRFIRTCHAINEYKKRGEQHFADEVELGRNLVKQLSALGEDDSPTRTIAIEGQGEIELTPSDFDTLLSIITDAQSQMVERFPEMTLDMAFVYLVARYDAFFSDLITLILTSRPEMLKNSKQLAFEKIIDLGSYDNVIRFMAEREVNELGYKSFRDQMTYLEKKFGIDLDSDKFSIDEITEAMARRNIIVHNNGVVNHRYLEEVSNCQFSIGYQVVMDSAYWEAAYSNFEALGKFIALKCVEQFCKRPS